MNVSELAGASRQARHAGVLVLRAPAGAAARSRATSLPAAMTRPRICCGGSLAAGCSPTGCCWRRSLIWAVQPTPAAAVPSDAHTACGRTACGADGDTGPLAPQMQRPTRAIGRKACGIMGSSTTLARASPMLQ